MHLWACLETVSILAFYGMCGAAIRQGLIDLTGFEYGGVLWANVAGCVIMGMHPTMMPEKHSKLIGSGVSGSITSFSSMIIALLQNSIDRQPSWNNSGYGIMVFLGYLIIEMSCSIGSYKFGQHVALAFRGWRTPEPRWVYYVLAASCVVWIPLLVVGIVFSQARFWCLSLVFAPFGVWGRFYLAKLNTPERKTGTWLANIIGTILAAILTLIQEPGFHLSDAQRHIVNALVSGFCGCLTTISTFVVELTTLPLKQAYTYFLASVVPAFICALLIIAPYKWKN